MLTSWGWIGLVVAPARDEAGVNMFFRMSMLYMCAAELELALLHNHVNMLTVQHVHIAPPSPWRDCHVHCNATRKVHTPTS